MKYDLKRPCSKCPFLRGGPMVLRRGRIRELHTKLARHNGDNFPCHQTVDYDSEETPRNTSETQHCAGALIYVDKHGKSSQLTRIAQRLGMLDLDALAEHADTVWDNLDQWLREGSTP